MLQKNAAGDHGKEKGKGGKGGRGAAGKRKREYVPQKRSGGYAVLLALYRESQVRLYASHSAEILTSTAL